MKSATAKELRNSAAAIIETVRKGHEIVITKRGKAVAVLKPIPEKPKPATPVPPPTRR